MTRLERYFMAIEMVYDLCEDYLKRYQDFEDLKVYSRDGKDIIEVKTKTGGQKAWDFEELVRLYKRKNTDQQIDFKYW